MSIIDLLFFLLGFIIGWKLKEKHVEMSSMEEEEP